MLLITIVTSYQIQNDNSTAILTTTAGITTTTITTTTTTTTSNTTTTSTITITTTIADNTASTKIFDIYYGILELCANFDEARQPFDTPVLSNLLGPPNPTNLIIIK